MLRVHWGIRRGAWKRKPSTATFRKISPESRFHMSKYRILVVDDVIDLCSTIVGILTDEGHEVRMAIDEVQALRLISLEEFDFAIVDVRLHSG